MSSKSLSEHVADDVQAIKKVAKGREVSYESAMRLLACGLLEPGPISGTVVLSKDGQAMHRTIVRKGR